MKKIIAVPLALSLLLTMVIAKPAKAADKGLLSIVGPIVGVPIGAVMGTVRGMTAKGVEYTGDFSEAMGDGFVGRLIGTPTGLIAGGVTGAQLAPVKTKSIARARSSLFILLTPTL